MTQASLQAFLVKDLGNYLKDYKFCNVSNKYEKINIYFQSLPGDNIYEETEQYDYFPFVIVEIPDGAIESIDTPHNVTVNFIIGTVEYQSADNGHFDVFTIINKILEYLTEKSSFNNKYTLNFPIKWQVNPDENAEPYFYGVVETSFTIPSITQYVK